MVRILGSELKIADACGSDSQKRLEAYFSRGHQPESNLSIVNKSALEKRHIAQKFAR